MKRLDSESVGDVLRQALSEQGMNDRLYEIRAINVWPLVVGEAIAAMAGRPIVTNGLMTIFVRNASLRQELNMSRSRIRDMINDNLGRQVISEIRFK
ncbi:MAG: DUF721 domain-containing protein [Muribaculaceae bacterium]|nr:DUF721 domain-containing protein [Muribaculaceae bacterium]